MSSPGYRRQVLLFLGAIILPCIVLVAMSVRMMAQQRELAEKRLADARSQVVRNIHQELFTRLEKIALQETTSLATRQGSSSLRHYDNPEVVLVSRIEKDRLIPPWETIQNEAQASFRLSEPSGIDAGENRSNVRNYGGAYGCEKYTFLARNIAP